jgi:DNA polymerase III subunit alpha
MPRFVHLHVHTHYSLLDGLSQIDPLVAKVKFHGMDACAITDHGAMYGAIEFYQACKKKDVKPLIGMEAYVAPRSRTEKSGRGGENDTSHLTLIAKNLTGYRNLMKLATRAQLEGFYYKPRIDHELLAELGEGIIALSGCMNGEIPKAILGNEPTRVRELIRKYKSYFGDDFYLEIQHHPTEADQEIVNQGLAKLSQEFGIPLVATQDSHYLEPDDNEAQDILVCVQTGKTVDDPKRLDMRQMDVSFPAGALMEERFRDYPGACEITGKIADKVDLQLDLGKWVFPNFVPPGGLSAKDYLEKLSHEMLDAKYGGKAPKEVTDRLEYELGIISKKGYDPYFLVVADYTNWARHNGITSTTRGSAAGSLVSYAIGISEVNPLFFKLPFERFLNPFRPSPPDIDMDFADNRREEVLEYVKGKYGSDKVAQICTFGTMQARAAVRDVTRALGLPYAFGDRMAKLIPPGAQGFAMTIDRAIDENSELKELVTRDPDAKRVIDLAKKVEGCVRHSSVHAAGVVIAPSPLTDFTPLQKESGGGDKIITQYDMTAVELAGTLKMDFLGIRNLSILGNAIVLIEKTKGEKIKLLDLPLEDKKTFEMLASGATFGVFQLSGDGMTKYLKELGPTSIFDLQAMVALYRPGPIDSIPEYISRKHNPSRVKYLDPRMQEILDQSYGVITYQDDVLLISIKLAGYSWEEADKFRKAMGKKIPEEMAKQKEKFWKGILANGGSENLAAELWKLIEPFAAYGFNKAHAASYAMVAFQTAYLKAHYPAEYMTSIMTAESDDLEKVAEAVAECGRMGISVLPPDVNSSFRDFTYIDDKHIRFGLLAIKNIGSDTVENIISERKKNGPFAALEDFLTRLNLKSLNRKSVESLIKSGAMDAFGDRQAQLDSVEAMLSFARENQKAASSSQSSLFGASLISAATVRLPDGVVTAKSDRLAWEKELLGLYVSEHPWKQWDAALRGMIMPLAEALTRQEGAAVIVGGVIETVKNIQTKSNETMAFVKLTDTSGGTEVIVFPSVYKLGSAMWTADRPIVVEGKISMKDGVPKIIANRAEVVNSQTIQRIREDFQPRSSQITNNNNQITKKTQLSNSNGTNQNADEPRATPVSSAVERSRGPVSVKVPPKLAPTVVNQLKAVFEKYPGSAPIELVYLEGGRARKVRTNFCVEQCDLFRDEIRNILGEESVN